jgi:nucleotide-binding universal stress UspA family protein
MDATANDDTPTGGTAPVVVAVDPSDSARAAAGWAADIAADRSAPLHLVHVAPGAADAPIPTPHWLTELVGSADRAGAHPCRADVVGGDTVHTIADAAMGARMLVLGSYGQGARSGTLAGTVARSLVGLVSCPVAVVRGTAPQIAPPRGGPIVVGVDGSAAGRAAVAFAAELADSLGARLVAVHTWTDVVAAPDGSAHRRSESEQALADEAATLLDERLRGIAAQYPALSIDRDVAEDTPLRALINRAPGARMLVVGNRGRRTGGGMLLGSTSHALVEFAPCPVVVVHPDAVGSGAAGAGRAEGP